MLTVRQLRSQLGLSQAAFASALGCAIRNITNWENGRALPSAAWRLRMRALVRARGLSKTSAGPIPLMYDPVKMEVYLGMPSAVGIDWKHLTYAQRASWWAHRARYRRLKADIQAGRVVAQSNRV